MNGYVLKRTDADYVVECNSQGTGGYNVVPRNIAPDCKYSITQVEDYLAEHPEMLLDTDAIEMQRLTRQARAKRDNLLKEVVDSVNPMRWELFTEEQKQAWRVYRQSLLDIPQQEGFPINIVWPETPY